MLKTWTLRELLRDLSQKELSVLLMGIGSSLIGWAVMGVVIALIG